MSFPIHTNVSSLIAQRYLIQNTGTLNQSLERLSTGLRVNRAADDAAGLQISEGLRAQIRGRQQAFDNAQEGVNLLNAVDGTYSSMAENLQRIRELAVRGFTDTMSVADKSAIALEINQLKEGIDGMAERLEYNGQRLLARAYEPTEFYIHVGANGDPVNDRVNIASAIGDATMNGGPTNRGLIPVTGFGFLFSTTASFVLLHSQANVLEGQYLFAVDSTIEELSMRRGILAGVTNRLESVSENLMIGVENFTAADSRIRDVDMGKEVAYLARSRILQQASASILAQANQLPSLALQLINTS